jgi:hypothetical protein
VSHCFQLFVRLEYLKMRTTDSLRVPFVSC